MDRRRPSQSLATEPSSSKASQFPTTEVAVDAASFPATYNILFRAQDDLTRFDFGYQPREQITLKRIIWKPSRISWPAPNMYHPDAHLDNIRRILEQREADLRNPPPDKFETVVELQEWEIAFHNCELAEDGKTFKSFDDALPNDAMEFSQALHVDYEEYEVENMMDNLDIQSQEWTRDDVDMDENNIAKEEDDDAEGPDWLTFKFLDTVDDNEEKFISWELNVGPRFGRIWGFAKRGGGAGETSLSEGEKQRLGIGGLEDTRGIRRGNVESGMTSSGDSLSLWVWQLPRIYY